MKQLIQDWFALTFVCHVCVDFCMSFRGMNALLLTCGLYVLQECCSCCSKIMKEMTGESVTEQVRHFSKIVITVFFF